MKVYSLRERRLVLKTRRLVPKTQRTSSAYSKRKKKKKEPKIKENNTLCRIFLVPCISQYSYSRQMQLDTLDFYILWRESTFIRTSIIIYFRYTNMNRSLHNDDGIETRCQMRIKFTAMIQHYYQITIIIKPLHNYFYSQVLRKPDWEMITIELYNFFSLITSSCVTLIHSKWLRDYCIKNFIDKRILQVKHTSNFSQAILLLLLPDFYMFQTINKYQYKKKRRKE